MKLTNLTIKDLLNENEKLTFLVGAGCSVDAPSCLPAGRQMIEAIIKYTCAESEIEKILELEDLRFEQLIEIVRDSLDKELKIIDYYGQCDKPNIQHFFLADKIKRGQFVMTTNFDFLLEYALLQSGIPREEIIPVITREDFEKFNDPNELWKQGRKAIYKIHGSMKNIVTRENTRTSLIATIRAFGANKEGQNVFQLESFKQPAFTKCTKGRTLVLMGYSGGDDFDIVPTLRVLKDIQDIIWINHVFDDKSKEIIYEMEYGKNYENLSKVDQILFDIKRMHSAIRVLRVNVNTLRLVRELIFSHPKTSSEPFNIDAYNWLSDNIKSPNPFIKIQIPLKIYYDFNMYDDAMRCSEKILKIAEKNNEQVWKYSAINNIGHIYYLHGNYRKALKQYEKTIHITEQIDDLRGKTVCLTNMGRIYEIQGNYTMALKLYEEAFSLILRLENNTDIVTSILSNIGMIYEKQGNYLDALDLYEKALNIDEQLGDLRGKATRLNGIGMIHKEQGNYQKALERCEEALKIGEQLGNLSVKARSLNNIGLIYYLSGNYTEALKQYKKSLGISESLGDLAGEASCLNNIGGIYQEQGNYPKALDLYEKALNIDEQLGDLRGKTIRLNNIGMIYEEQKNFPKALDRCKKALNISEKLGDLRGKAICLNNIGHIYRSQENYLEALRRFEKALHIFKQLGLNHTQEVLSTKENYEFIKKIIRKNIGRNDLCYCGSKKKYKNCHWREDKLTKRTIEKS